MPITCSRNRKMVDKQWSFLSPWFRVLKRVLEYDDHDELDVGTMQDRLKYVRLCLNELVEKADDDAFDRQVIDLREGLELLSLALHYDPRVWRDVLHQLIDKKNPFPYDAVQLQPLIQIVFVENRDEEGGLHSIDEVGGFHRIVQLFSGISRESLSTAYATAKQAIKSLVGLEWDEEYRIPVSIRVEPSTSDWADRLLHLVWELQAPSHPFQLVSLDLSVPRTSLTSRVVSLLAEIRLASVVLKTLGLPLEIGGVDVGTAINAATGATHRHQRSPQLVEALALDAECSTDFGQLCSSVALGRTLESLTTSIWGGGQDRVISWRWLSFALRGRFASRSLRHLRLDQGSVTETDIRSFADWSYDLDTLARPKCPNYSDEQVVLCIQLRPDALVGMADGSWHSLDDAALSADDKFIVVDDSVRENTALVAVVIPGHGCCMVKATDIVQAEVATVQQPTTTHLESLDINILCKTTSLTVSPLTTLFATSLRRLQIEVKSETTLERADAIAMFTCCPLLEMVNMKRLNVGTMDVILEAYSQHGCRVRVLSLEDSRVDPASFVRFATALKDPASPLALHLFEFRYMFELTQPRIITVRAVLALYEALQVNHRLQFLDIGLTKDVYDKYAKLLCSEDRPTVLTRWMATKLGLLCVIMATGASMSSDQDSPTAAKRPRPSLPSVPIKHRRKLVANILQFIKPPLTRDVSVVRVPRGL